MGQNVGRRREGGRKERGTTRSTDLKQDGYLHKLATLNQWDSFMTKAT